MNDLAIGLHALFYKIWILPTIGNIRIRTITSIWIRTINYINVVHSSVKTLGKASLWNMINDSLVLLNILLSAPKIVRFSSHRLVKNYKLSRSIIGLKTVAFTTVNYIFIVTKISIKQRVDQFVPSSFPKFCKIIYRIYAKVKEMTKSCNY